MDKHKLGKKSSDTDLSMLLVVPLLGQVPKYTLQMERTLMKYMTKYVMDMKKGKHTIYIIENADDRKVAIRTLADS